MQPKRSLSHLPRPVPPALTASPVLPRKRRLILPALSLALIVLAAILVSLLFARTTNALDLPRKFNAGDIHVVGDSYNIQVAVANLTAPTAAVFDGNDLLVAESGSLPRILRIKENGTISVVVSRGLRGPVTGLALRDGQLYVSHKGKVSVVKADGKLSDIVTDLPSEGENQNNQIAFGPDGKLYLGQGTVTNSGVVGLDDYALGWLDLNPEAHEIPCQNIQLLGQNFQSPNPLVQQATSILLTGAYKAFGEPTIADENIQGSIPCGGSIIRFNRDGSNAELVAWGLRNPVGLTFDKAGQLWVTSQGAEARGSRSIEGDPDYLVRVERGAWYGWPDYFDGRPVTDERFHTPGKPPTGMLWATHPALSKPFLTLPPQSATSGFAFSPGGAFGFEGDAFVAMAGPRGTANESAVAGFRIARIDLRNRLVYDLATNVHPGPAYRTGSAGFDHPLDALFGPDGSLYVVDAGELTTGRVARFTPGTGAIWRISPANSRVWLGAGMLAIPSDSATRQGTQPIEISGDLYSALANLPPFIVMFPGALFIVVLIVGLVRQLVRTR